MAGKREQWVELSEGRAVHIECSNRLAGTLRMIVGMIPGVEYDEESGNPRNLTNMAVAGALQANLERVLVQTGCVIDSRGFTSNTGAAVEPHRKPRLLTDDHFCSDEDQLVLCGALIALVWAEPEVEAAKEAGAADPTPSKPASKSGGS